MAKTKPFSAVAFAGKTRVNAYFPANLRKARKAVVLFYGLPRHYPIDYSNPAVKNFLSENFVVFCPEYEGTFGSGGKFSCKGALASAAGTISLAMRGECVDAWSGNKMRWKVKEVVLAGASFGGAVALVAGAKNAAVSAIISMAPVTDFAAHAKIREEKEGFGQLRKQIERAFPHLWKIDAGEWNKMEQGKVELNAVEYARVLAEKSVLLIHGIDDDVVSVKRSRDMHEMLKQLGGKGKRRLIELEKAGHVGIGLLGNKKMFAQVKKFLK